MKVFISYSHHDKWVAQQISSQIIAHGHETFLDEKDIDTGDSIDESLQMNLAECDELLIIVSPDSLKSHWVFIEIGGAKALKKRIIPILLHVQSNEIPPPISKLLARDINEIEIYYKELDDRERGRKIKKVKKQRSKSKVGEFALGDRVKVVDVRHLTQTDKEIHPGWVPNMDKYSGAITEISRIEDKDHIKILADEGRYFWSAQWLIKTD